MVMFLQCLNTSIITVPLPEIAGDLDITVSESSWLLLAYSLGTCALLLQFAKFGKNNRLKKLFVYGTGIFIIASAACAFLNQFLALTLMRIVQGAAISMAAAACPIIVIDYLPEDRQGYALGSMASGTGLAMVLGPSVGGILSQIITWHYLFLVNIPLAVMVLIGALKYLPADRKPVKKNDPDAMGSICWFIAIAASMVFLENITAWGIELLLPFGIAAYVGLFLLAFRLTDNKLRQPILSPGMLKNRAFLLIAISAMMGSMITEGALYLLPYLMQIAWNMDVMECRMYCCIVSVAAFVSARFVGSYCDNHSSKVPVICSFVCTIVFDTIFTFIQPDWSLAILVLSATMVGITFAVFETAQYIRMIRHTRPEYKEEAATMITVLTYIGASLGLIAYSLMFNAAIPEAMGAEIDELTATLMTKGFNATGVLGLFLGLGGLFLASIVKENNEDE
ncbi:MAG: MFS transporter [archaeon]|nr:MFS transporter [archaeon]